jgi:hypothetical protein
MLTLILLSILPEVIALLDTKVQLHYYLLYWNGEALLDPTATSVYFQIPWVLYAPVVISKEQLIYLGMSYP